MYRFGGETKSFAIFRGPQQPYTKMYSIISGRNLCISYNCKMLLLFPGCFN